MQSVRGLVIAVALWAVPLGAAAAEFARATAVRRAIAIIGRRAGYVVTDIAHKMRRRRQAAACMAWQKCAAAMVIGVRSSRLSARS